MHVAVLTLFELTLLPLRFKCEAKGVKHFLLALCFGGSQRLDSVKDGERKSTPEPELKWI